MFAGTEYTTYVAFKNIADNYTAVPEEYEWATEAGYDVIYTNIVLNAALDEVMTATIVEEAAKNYAGAVGYPIDQIKYDETW